MEKHSVNLSRSILNFMMDTQHLKTCILICKSLLFLAPFFLVNKILKIKWFISSIRNSHDLSMIFLRRIWFVKLCKIVLKLILRAQLECSSPIIHHRGFSFSCHLELFECSFIFLNIFLPSFLFANIEYHEI